MAAAPENKDKDAAATIDRRLHERFSSSCSAVFHREGAEEVTVRFHDVSTGGVSFTSHEPLKIGQQGVLEVSFETAPGSRRYEVVILWAVSNEVTKRFRVGGKWLAPIPDADLAFFM